MAEPVNYRIQAVPTRYRSIEFDSRLEARWAAFFDECGWQWSYHPADLHGWFPDFQLTVGGETLLVEVKPIRQPHGPTWARMVAATQLGRAAAAGRCRTATHGVALPARMGCWVGRYPPALSLGRRKLARRDPDV